MMNRLTAIGILACLLLIAGSLVWVKVYGSSGIVSVEKIERDEALKYHMTAVQAQAMRDRFVDYLARRYGVDLEIYQYKIDSGEFVPKPVEKK